jgi:hypothetical protein
MRGGDEADAAETATAGRDHRFQYLFHCAQRFSFGQPAASVPRHWSGANFVVIAVGKPHN